MDPSIAAAKISDLAAMGNERTALDRVDGIVSRVELYFENPAAENVFRDSRGQWKSGPAAVFSKAIVAGLAPPEFKLKVQSKLDMMGGWKDKPDNVIELIREAAIDWRTVEQADKRRG